MSSCSPRAPTAATDRQRRRAPSWIGRARPGPALEASTPRPASRRAIRIPSWAARETSWSPVPPIPTCWTSTWSWCANHACPRARRCASVRADATPETDARPVTSKRWHGGVTVLAAIAIILVLTNIVLFERNCSLQAEVSARAQYIQQTTQLEILNREIVNAIANLAVRNRDDALRALLTQQGITINMGAGQGAPPPAGPSPEGRR